MMTKTKYVILVFISVNHSFIATDNNQPCLSQQEKAWEYMKVAVTPEMLDFNTWLFCFLHSLVRRIEDLELKMEHERTTCSSLPPVAAEILQMIQNKGKATMTDIEYATNASRSTIKKYLNFLIDQKYIMRHGKGRAIWYTLA